MNESTLNDEVIRILVLPKSRQRNELENLIRTRECWWNQYSRVTSLLARNAVHIGIHNGTWFAFVDDLDWRMTVEGDLSDKHTLLSAAQAAIPEKYHDQRVDVHSPSGDVYARYESLASGTSVAV